MKATGIVVEYNPLHKGHLYHIQRARQITGCDVLIAVMSGNFVQRGEMAIVDKWQRAKAAVENGVDLIIELPYLWATQSAQQFADGAITLLNLAKADNLVFGSECGELDTLEKIAAMSFQVNYLREALNAGEGYAKAYSLGSAVMQPNDILAVAYLKALKNTAITPYCIKRIGNYHDLSIQPELASAAAIRKAYLAHEDVSAQCVLSLHEPTQSWHKYFPYLKILFLTLKPEYIREIFLFNEGIENHLLRCIQQAESWDEFLALAVNKRYTRSRIQRTCLQLLNQITKKEAAALPPLNTLRILAFNAAGQRYLKELKKREVPIASRFAQVPFEYREMELKTTRLYASLFPSKEARKLIELEIGGALRIQHDPK